MKLLFDQNLSHNLVRALADLFPDCAHVRHFELKEAEDPIVWDFARSNGYVIVSKDDDFTSGASFTGIRRKSSG